VVEFQLLFGILLGVAGGAIFPPTMATVAGWFETQRSLAVSLVSAGMGMAPMTVSPIAARLVETYDWRTCLMMIGVAGWCLLLPVALLVRRPPGLRAGARGNSGAAPAMSVRQALLSRPFLVISATYFCCCATHSGPLFHTVSYAITCGLPVAAAVSIYSVEGLAGLGGRVLFGLAGDRFGAKQVLVAGLLVQALAAGAYALVSQMGEFYAVAVVFGMAYAGVMPLYAVLIRENFPLSIIGTVIGAASLTSSLGMAVGPLAGGMIYDAFATYRWLYVLSLALGLGAMAIMLTFRPRRLVVAAAE
jgi:MFS family permease